MPDQNNSQSVPNVVFQKTADALQCAIALNLLQEKLNGAPGKLKVHENTVSGHIYSEGVKIKFLSTPESLTVFGETITAQPNDMNTISMLKFVNDFAVGLANKKLKENDPLVKELMDRLGRDINQQSSVQVIMVPPLDPIRLENQFFRPVKQDQQDILITKEMLAVKETALNLVLDELKVAYEKQDQEILKTQLKRLEKIHDEYSDIQINAKSRIGASFAANYGYISDKPGDIERIDAYKMRVKIFKSVFETYIQSFGESEFDKHAKENTQELLQKIMIMEQTDPLDSGTFSMIRPVANLAQMALSELFCKSSKTLTDYAITYEEAAKLDKADPIERDKLKLHDTFKKLMSEPFVTGITAATGQLSLLGIIKQSTELAKLLKEHPKAKAALKYFIDKHITDEGRSEIFEGRRSVFKFLPGKSAILIARAYRNSMITGVEEVEKQIGRPIDNAWLPHRLHGIEEVARPITSDWVKQRIDEGQYLSFGDFIKQKRLERLGLTE